MTLAPGLLTGATVALAGAGPVTDGTAGRLDELGATVHAPDAATLADATVLAQWAGAQAPWRALVVDATGPFGEGGAERLTAMLHDVWSVIQTVATAAMLPAGQPARIVLIAPSPDAGLHAGAARAGLENLARTLSVEWARHAITPVAVLPGNTTAPSEIAELVAYLVSPAGAYLSGCRLELGVVTPA